jgi:hypothetical protein
MTGYRCYFLDDQDRIESAEDIEAEGLDEASFSNMNGDSKRFSADVRNSQAFANTTQTRCRAIWLGMA